MYYGEKMYTLAEELFPICRSITGNGVRQTLAILQRVCPELTIHEVPSGTQVFDWTVPKEWNIKDAYIKAPDGHKIIDFNKSNLHVMGYSIPVHKTLKRDELLQYIYTEPSQPHVIPYITSYYKERFGFCMSEEQKDTLLRDYSEDAEFEICIDSELKDGFLTYGEIIIPGKHKQEIFLSTYICHPSLANNELSGPCLAIYLADWIKTISERLYTYRIIFVPESIGAITYLSRNLDILKKNVVSGFQLSCVGDDRTYSCIGTRLLDTLADKVINNILRYHYLDYKKYSFLDRGSDEKHYNSPGVDLPVVGFCRSKYGEYPEYHTSADNLSLISPAGLQGSFDVMTKCIQALENNRVYKITTLCEPQLGKRGLYPTLSRKGQYSESDNLKNLLAYADGTNDLIDISNIIGVPVSLLFDYVNTLKKHELLVEVEKTNSK